MTKLLAGNQTSTQKNTLETVTGEIRFTKCQLFLNRKSELLYGKCKTQVDRFTGSRLTGHQVDRLPGLQVTG